MHIVNYTVCQTSLICLHFNQKSYLWKILIIVELIYNLSLLVSLSVLSGFIDARFKRTETTGKIFQGLLFGITAIIGMLYPFVLTEGIIFDGRTIVVSLCTLFFGPISGFISVVLAASLRFYIGGAGIIMGVLTIVEAFLVGYAFYYFKQKSSLKNVSNMQLYLLGLIVHIIMLALIFSLPSARILQVYQTIGITVIGVYPFMTLIIGKILHDQESSGQLVTYLKKSEEKFRTLVEHAFDGIYMMDDTRYTYVNERFCEITGYSNAELISKDFDFTKLLTEKSLDLVNERYLARKRGESIPLTYSIQLKRKDNAIKEVELSTASIGSKEHISVIGIMRDITERKLVEEDLKKSKERMQVLVEGTPHLFFYVQDVEGYVKYISPSVEKITGYTVEEWLGQRHWYVTDSKINDEAKRRTHMHLSGVINTDPVFVEIKHADNSHIILEVYEKPIFHESKVVGLQGVAHDVTRQKVAEDKLKELNTRLQTAIDGANIGIWDQDFDTGKVLRLGRWGEMLGYSTETINDELISWKELIHPDDYNLVEDAIVQHENMRIPEFKVEHRLRTASGDYKWILNWGRIYERDENGKPRRASGIHLDVDERKRAELELEAAKLQAERANQLKSEFLAQISHEIRSPLNAVLNFSQLLKEEFADKMHEDVKVSFSGIESASKRVIRTVDLILNMSELQLGTYEVVNRNLNLIAILSNIRKEYSNLARTKKLELRFTSNVEEAEINSDEYAVIQIFANLVDNAIKYTKEGYVEIGIDKNQTGSFKVSVTDTGIGMSKEYQEQIFEAFSQEERGYTRRFEGSGLGMSLVKNYCLLIGAEINIQSEQGKGTTFTVFLP